MDSGQKVITYHFEKINIVLIIIYYQAANTTENNTAPTAIFRIFHNNITTFCRFLLLENTKNRLSVNIRIMVVWTSTNWNILYVTQISDKHNRKMKFAHVSIFTLYSFII